MTKNDFQKLHGFSDQEMDFISLAISTLHGQIVTITNKPILDTVNNNNGLKRA